MHPSVLVANGPKQGENVGVTEFGRVITEHESAAEVVDERHPPIARREHYGPLIGDHLQSQGLMHVDPPRAVNGRHTDTDARRWFQRTRQPLRPCYSAR